MVSPLHCVYSILYPAGMASLVEFQDFNLNPHHSVMMPTIPEMQTLEEIMAQDVVSVEPLPTPPLSPDHDICCSSPSSESSSHHDHDLDSGDGLEIMAEALINEMISYEQLFVEAMDESGTGAQGSSSFSLEGHFLVQDCMWNSQAYQPRNTIGLGVEGVYTPAPSPPSQVPSSAEQNNQEEGEEEEGEDASTPRNDASSDSSSTSDQTDCISPNDVFPTCMAMPTLNSDEDEDTAMEEPTTTTATRKKVKVQPVRHTRQERARRAMEREQRSTRGGGERTSSIMTRRASANTNGNSRIQPQASASSESGKWNFNF